jgi:ketosteroid isomerase-like protein
MLKKYLRQLTPEKNAASEPPPIGRTRNLKRNSEYRGVALFGRGIVRHRSGLCGGRRLHRTLNRLPTKFSGAPTVNRGTKMTSVVEANKQVALQFLDCAFNIRMDEAISMLTNDATWWVIGDPQRLRIAGPKTREQTIRMLTNMHKVLPHGMAYQITGITAEHDRVAVEVEAEGSWKDETPYRNTYHFLIRVRDNRIAVIREYMDTMQII